MRVHTPIFCLLIIPFLAYSESAQGYESTYNQVSAAGSFNGWNSATSNLQLVDDYIWRGDIQLPPGEHEFKFTTPGFANNWGIPSFPHQSLPQAGAGVLDSGNIRFDLNTNTIVRFMFNDQTLRYSLMAMNQTFTNLLFNGRFETAGSNADRARYWEMGNPNAHGAVAGATRRVDWSPPGPSPFGDWIAAILGTWAGAGTSGAWWQEAPVEPGVTYEASAYFYAEGAPNQWTAEEQALKLEFFDFNGNMLTEHVLDLESVTNDWQSQTVSGVAPPKAAWGRFVVFAVGTGPSGTFVFDNARLEAVSSSRTQDFNDWFGAETDGNYLLAGWRVNTGKMVSTVVDGIYTTQLARSGLAASLANPGGDTNLGGFVRSPRLQGGIGTVTFYYRHGFTGDPEEGPEEPVSFRVQKSQFGEFWTTIAEVNNIFTIDHVRYDAFEFDNIARYIRIQHTGSSTNRLIIDDIEVGFPETAPRFMNFDTWPVAGETPDCHTYLSWQVCTGMVVEAFAKAGKAAQIFGAEGNPNYLQAPAFNNGYGPISFFYRRGTNGLNTVGFALEASTDGDDWVELDRVEGIFETSWQEYNRFFYETTPHYIRIRNLIEESESEGGAVLLFEPFDGGSQAPPGWTFNQIGQYNSNASSGESGPPSLQFANNAGNSFVITPDVANPTNIQFMIRGNSTGGDSTFHVRGWENGQWVTIKDITSFSGAVGGEIRSFPVSTNMTRFQFQYSKDLGNVAFDDLLITGLPPEDDDLPQILMLDEVMIGNPIEYRSQNFNSWPTKGSYAPDFSQHQFWTLTGDHIVDSQNAFEGQVARLRRPSGGPDPAINSHFFNDGIGSIDFVYRAWSTNELNIGFRVQVSEDGENWTTPEFGTVTGVTNTYYINFSLFIGDPDAHYMRIVQHAGNNNARLLVDNISIPRPQPPPNVLLTGWHKPERPYIDDEVTLFASAIPQFGASGILITSYYRIGTTGAWTAETMVEDSGQWRITNNIPEQPTGTLVQYYMEANFSGPGGQSGTVFFPAPGETDPAFYQIPRNRPGSVWINEIDYVNWADESFNFFNKEFIELAGVAGADIGDWRLEIRDGGDVAQPMHAEYDVPADSVIEEYADIGFGFFVFAGEDLDSPPRDITLTNFLNELAIGAVLLLNELGQVEDAWSYGGFAQGYNNIPVEDDDGWPPMTNAVALTGTGSQSGHFDWETVSPPTPGEPNPGQIFADPGIIDVDPGSLAFQYIAGSYPPPPQSLVISNAGESVLSYSVFTNASWLSVEPSSVEDLEPGDTVTHTVIVNTMNRVGNFSGNISFAGAPGDSPVVPVSLTQILLPQALLRYPFDLGSGLTALNAGTAGTPGNLTRAGATSWTLSGGGASGAGGDYAMNFTDETARLHTAGAVSSLNARTRLTVTGWLRTTGENDNHRLAGNRLGSDGFDLLITSNYSRLGFVSSAGGSPEPVLSSETILNTNDWTFFAVTFDNTEPGTSAVSFYVGTLSNSVALLSSHAVGDLGPTGTTTNRFFVGGDGVTAFIGTLDDVRVFTNKLDIMALEGLRKVTEDRHRDAGENVPPSISQHPEDQTVTIDQSATFSVTASGDPAPTYQWRHNGSNIVGATLSFYFISAAQPSQMGMYDVVVNNIEGTVTSQVANLFVNHAPGILTQPDDRHVYIGMVASLSVEVSGYPPPTFRWRMDGQDIPANQMPTYQIASARLVHNGEYQVTVSNELGVVQSRVATVRVLDPNAFPFTTDDALGPEPGGAGIVLRWQSAYGRVFDVYWGTNLMNGYESFIPIATGLPPTPPMNMYTDSVYGVESSGFYFIDIREEAE